MEKNRDSGILIFLNAELPVCFRGLPALSVTSLDAQERFRAFQIQFASLLPAGRQWGHARSKILKRPQLNRDFFPRYMKGKTWGNTQMEEEK